MIEQLSTSLSTINIKYIAKTNKLTQFYHLILKNMKKFYLFILLPMLFTLFAGSAAAQILFNTFTVVSPFDKCMAAKSAQFKIGAFSAAYVDITMPYGITYEVGSAKCNGVAMPAPTATTIALGATVYRFTFNAAPNDTGVFVYKHKADCIVDPNAILFDIAQLPGGQANQSQSYNVSEASPQVIALAHTPANAEVGQWVTRCVTIKNNGLGDIDHFFYDEIYQGNQLEIDTNSFTIAGFPIPGSQVRPVVSGGGFDTLTVSIQQTDIIHFGNFDTVFDGNKGTSPELTQICYKVRPKICNSPAFAIGSLINLYYSCSETDPYATPYCSDVYFNGSVGVTPPASPLISSYVTANPRKCNNTDTFVKQTIGYYNTGGMARDLRINVGEYMASEYYLYYVSNVEIDTASISVKDKNGNPLSYIIDSIYKNTLAVQNGYQNMNFCSLLGKINQFRLFIPELPGGDSAIISYYYKICCNSNVTCKAGGTGIAAAGEWPDYQFSKATYYNDCKEQILVRPIQAFYGENYNADIEQTFPTDMSSGVPATFIAEILPTASDARSQVNGGYFEITTDIPYAWSYVPGTVSLTRPGGYSWPGVITNTKPLVVRFYYPVPTGMVSLGNSSAFKFDAVLDCNLLATDANATFKQTIKTVQDSNCACQNVLVCMSKSVVPHCPGCSTDALINTSFNFKRSNFGAPDNDENGLADATGAIDLNIVRKDRMTTDDTASMVFTGYAYIQAGNANFTGGYADITLPLADPTSTNWILIPNGNLKIYRGGVLFYDGNNVVSSSPAVNKLKLDFSAGIASIGGLINNDSVVIVTKVVNNYNPGGAVVPVIANSRYYATRLVDPAGPSADWYSCDSWSSALSIVGYYHTRYWFGKQLITSCEPVRQGILDYMSMGPCCSNYQDNYFPGEVNQRSYLDSIKFKLPLGVKLSKARTSFYRSAGVGKSELFIQDSIPVNVQADGWFGLKLKNYYSNFGGNALNPISDNGWFTYTDVFVTATCKVVNNVDLLFPAKEYFAGLTPNFLPKSGGNDFPGLVRPSGLYEINVENGYEEANYPIQRAWIAYTPVLTGVGGSNSNQIIRYKTLSWNNIKLQNLSTTTAAGFTWIKFKKRNAASQILIDSVFINGAYATPDANGYYRMGTTAAAALPVIDVKATYPGCNADSIKMYYGWDCSEYPTAVNPDSVCSYAPLWLKVFPLLAKIDGNITSVNNTPINPSLGSGSPLFNKLLVGMCQNVPVEMVLNAAFQGDLLNVSANTKMPTGIRYVPNSCYIEYPSGSTPRPITAAAEALLVATAAGGTLPFNLQTMDPVNFDIAAIQGLSGSLDPVAANSKALIRYNVTSDCSYNGRGRMQMTMRANKVCGNKAISDGGKKSGSRLVLDPGTTPYGTSIITPSYGTVQGCNGTVTGATKFLKQTSDPILITDSISYEVDLSVDITNFACANCITPIGAPTVTYDLDAGKKYYKFQYPQFPLPNYGFNTPFDYTYLISTDVNQSCEYPLDLVITADQNFVLFCYDSVTTLSTACPPKPLITGLASAQIPLDKPKFTVTNATLTSLNDGLYSYKGIVDIKNTGTYTSDSVNILYIQDIDEDGFYSPEIDTVFFKKTLAPIAAGVTLKDTSKVVLNKVPVDGEVVLMMITPKGKDTANGTCTCSDALDTVALRVIEPSSIGNKVWLDNNKNGIADANEPGVSGVTVSLLDKDGQIIATTVTDALGNYLFQWLESGKYSVAFTPPANKGFTIQTTGADDNNSNPSAAQGPNFGKTQPIILGEGENNRTIDAGLIDIITQNIGNKVWFDADKDGIQDNTPEESGIAGVSVSLYNAAGIIVASTITDQNGEWYGINIPPGNYYVGFTPPVGLVFTTNGGPVATGSDASPITGLTNPFTVFAGISNYNIDAGLYPQAANKATVGDKVWNDLNNNGIQDAGEPGLAGVQVTLLDAVTGIAIANTTTDIYGNYIFNNLDSGLYSLNFFAPAGFTNSPVAAGTDPTKDSDNPLGAIPTKPFTLSPGETNLTIDAGFHSTSPNTASLGDKVWYDANNNGIQDPGEGGVSGVTVRLINAATGAFVATTATDPQGNYLFPNLPAGSYKVLFTNLPIAYDFVTKGAGTAATGSDANPSGLTDVITLAAGQQNLDVDAGIIRNNINVNKASIGDKVFYDRNFDGIQDAGENGVQGVTVTLYAENGTTVIATTITDGLGNYIFSDLNQGEYVIGMSNLPAGYVISPKDAGANDVLDSDIDPITNKTSIISLGLGQNLTTVDAGVFNPTQNGAIGNRVWNDLNNNGIQDAGEPGVPGITLYLYNDLGAELANTVTDANGNYMFNALKPGGKYQVEFSNTPPGFVFTAKGAGANPALDGDEDFNGLTTIITLPNVPNALDTTIDAGIYNPNTAALSGNVWKDNYNGTREPTEQLLAGILVSLYDANNNVIATAITDGNGFYSFPNLPPGTYSVGFEKPLGSEYSPQDIGGSDLVDSDPNPLTGRTLPIVLAAGDNKTNVDAGINVLPKATVGDFVWFDNNSNGIQDATEQGVPGVLVTLYDNGVVVGYTVTDANGFYKIDDVTPSNNLTMGFTLLPDNALFTTQSATNTANGSDANINTGLTPPFTLVANQFRTDIDAGIKVPASIGSFVWYDLNNNGYFETGESPVPNVIVDVYDAATNLKVGTDTTDAKGLWKVTGINAGNYYAIINTGSLPVGYQISDSLNRSGAKDSVDNDANKLGTTLPISVEAGQYNPNLWAGIAPNLTGKIGNFVWLDLDKDGEVSPGEPGVAGVTVSLYAGTKVIATTVTDAQGKYLFTDVPPATNYKVGFTPPAGLDFTKPNQGGADNNSNANPTPGLNYGLSGVFALPAGGYDTTRDAGLITIETQSIGNKVWFDANKDGIQDNTAAESGIAGVTVTLLDANDAVIATTVTNQIGEYYFYNVPPADYKVRFTAPIEMLFTSNAGPITTGSDANPANGETPIFTLLPGVDNFNIDAGLYLQDSIKASAGDKVWNDVNKNGIQDAGEPGIGGVTVQLVDAITGLPVKSTVTDELGNYIFNDLAPGTYYVQFTTPSGFSVSPSNAGTNDEKDNDITTAGKTEPFTLVAGENNTTIDAGYFTTFAPGDASLGDKVWYDNNNDGIQDASENGVAGITVQLLDNTNTIIATTVTDANGNYFFPNLAPSTYRVKFSNLPSAYGFTTKEATLGDAIGSDANSSGITDEITLNAGQSDITIDAGIIRNNNNIGTANLGDKVFFDTNKDGIQDPNESGVAGVKVRLFSIDGNLVAETVTNALGEYLFSNVDPGMYYVTFATLPAGTSISPKDATTDDAADSDVFPTGETDIFSLAAGENKTDLDLGIFQSNNNLNGSIGDRVWFDVNNDGIQDATEAGVPGVSVDLYSSATGLKIASTTTDADGNYKFNNLPVGASYQVKFLNIPAGFVFSPADQGANDAIDGDANKQGITGIIVLPNTPNAAVLTVDAGIYSPTAASLSGTAWNDKNNDGINDATEKPIPGLIVTLYDASGTPIGKTITDGNGNYDFFNLPAGTYSVGFELPAGSKFSPNGTGADSTIDSDVLPNIGQTAPINLAAGQNKKDVDAGINTPQLASVGNYVWNDSDNDGIQDATEKGIAGVKVTLYDNGIPVAHAITDANGAYTIDNVPAGTNYTIGFENLPIDATFTTQSATNTADGSDANATTGLTPVFTLTAGQNRTDIDAGIKLPASVGSFVWYDADNDGIFDVTELPVPNVVITVFDATTNLPVGSDTTDAKGLWKVSGLPAGTYYTIVDLASLPLNYEISDIANPAGISDAIDNDANKLGKTTSINVVGGEYNPSTWTGIKPVNNGAIGNLVWLDTDKDGLKDANEIGAAGVTVTLYDATGNVIATTITDAFGKYLFSSLPAGNYQLGFTPPTGLDFSPVVINDNGDNNNNANPANGPSYGKSTIFSLATGAVDTSRDAGLVTLTTQSIGNKVWLDEDKDGIQDASEAGISGVTVTLKDAAGLVLATTVTNNNGEYYFQNVIPGNYAITFTQPIGMVFTTQSAASDSIGSDANVSTGTTAVFAVVEGQNRFDIDAGLHLQNAANASVGNKVWEDLNNNGIQDAGEPGIAGALVILKDETGGVVATTVTDEFGNYVFNNVAPGVYSIAFTGPVGFNASPRGVGADKAADSDISPTGATAPFTLSAGEIKTDVDAGYNNPIPAGTLKLGDKVWYDDNKNGVQDATEVGVAGITVTLLNATTGAPIATTTTDAMGNYIFPNLVVGNYKVAFTNLPLNYVITSKGAGTATDNDANASGITDAIALSADNLNIDAGIYKANTQLPNGSIGDKVFFDANADGKQDPLETGVAGVKVILYAANGTTPIDSTVTNGLGEYIFTNVPAGDYVVEFSNLPVGTVFSPANTGADDNLDSDVLPTGKTGTISVAQGENKTNVDAGITQPNPNNNGSIGDKVWFDANNNGLQDANEVGAPGVTVDLFNGNTGVKIATTVTDANGNYKFNNLPVGANYQVKFSNLPSGFVFTTANVGANDAIDNDANGNGITSIITLPNVPNASNTTVDAGIYNPNAGSISGTVWQDVSKDGINNTTEAPIAGIIVTLYDGAGNPIATTVTKGDGTYDFFNLPPGTYSVGFTKPDGSVYSPAGAGTDPTKNSDVDPLTGRTNPISLLPGETKKNIDAGIYTPQLASVGNFVWNDIDGNGVQDAGENGIAGVVVELKNANGDVVGAAVTDQNGFYMITDVPGDQAYTVQFSNLPNGAVFTTQTLGTPNGSDANNTGLVPGFLLPAGVANTSIDAGIKMPTILGSFVWNDVNNNGIYDPATETPKSGVTITVYDAGNNAVGSAITDANGLWKVVVPGQGNYSVQIDTTGTGLFPSMAHTTATNGVADAGGVNNDFDRTFNKTITPIFVKGGTYNSTVWGGLTNLVSPLSLNIVLVGKINGTTNDLSWTDQDPTDVAYYLLTRNGVEITKTNNGVFNYTDANPELVSTYMITAYSVNATQLFSNKVTLNRVNQTNGLLVTPNPVVNTTNVTYFETINGEVNVRVLDAAGKVVRMINTQSVLGNNTIQVDMSELASGVYMLNVETAGGAFYTQMLRKQ
jgi:protocatechuate 3,4-dioxygenase beta subunit